MTPTERTREDLCDLPLLVVGGADSHPRRSPRWRSTERVLARIAALDADAQRLHHGAGRAGDGRGAAGGTGDPGGVLSRSAAWRPGLGQRSFSTKGIRTTAGSRVLADHVPDQDATVVERLRGGGAVLVGKTNMLEFAYAAVHADYGPTPNPWDLTRSSSGSSSGSAVAVAPGWATARSARIRAARSGCRRPTAASSG